MTNEPQNEAHGPTNSKATTIPPNTKSLDELFAAAERPQGADTRPLTSEAAAAHDQRAESDNVTVTSEGSGPLPVPKQPCSHHENTMRRQCPACRELHCPICSSAVDPDYCYLCLPYSDAVIKEHELVDQDGITHEGRLMIPGPSFSASAKAIADMTQSELEEHVSRYKVLIKQAETALDFRRVRLGMFQMELETKRDQQRRRLRGVKIAQPKKNTVSVSDPSKPAPKPAPNLMQMAKAIEQIMQLRKMKQQQAVKQPVTTVQQTKTTETKP